MISQRFIREIVNNPFLSDRQKFQIYLDKVSKSQEARKKFPCPKCGDYSSHIVKRSTYWKRLCASCGQSFDKHQNLEYQHKFYDYKGCYESKLKHRPKIHDSNQQPLNKLQV